MGCPLVFLHNHVWLFLDGIMEEGSQLAFMNTLLPFVGVAFLIALGVVILMQQFLKNLYREQLQQEELKSKHQLELLRYSIRAQEEERKRIAQDLHDELGAILSITRVYAMRAERLIDSNQEQLRLDLHTITGMTGDALENMRRISHELMPPQLEKFGWLHTIETIAAQMNHSGELQVEVVCKETIPLLTKEVELTLYRVIMELINNTLKHADASLIRIEINADAEKVYVIYTDDGKGLPADAPFKGLGHKNMEGRMHSLGGTIQFGHTSRRSFQAILSVPFGINPE